MNIFVGSIPFKLQEEELKELFEEFGEVSSIKVITDKFTGRSRGFGFIEMPNEEEATRAIEELNGTEVLGRAIVVNKAEDRSNNRRGGGGGGFRRDNNRGGGGYNRGGDRW